jgi:hypothetical protein
LTGRRIFEIILKNKSGYTDDFAHMKKVTGYVHRHRVQRPKGGVEDSEWRYSLMNWGYLPLK